MSSLRKLATGQNIIFLLVLFLLANMVIIPATYPKFQTLDTLSSYTPQEAYRYIGSYRVEGRQAYAKIELTLDLVYPLISALLFSLGILYTFQRGFPHTAWLHKLGLLPFGVLLADFLENACVLTMLWSYPRVLFSIASISNALTVIKSALSWIELVLLTVGLLAWLVQSIRRRRNVPVMQ